MTKRSGHCLCGAVQVTADLNDTVEACHCGMCQRWTGSALMSIAADGASTHFEGEDNIGLFSSSDWAERGFCKQCGTGLFYRVTAPGPFQHRHFFPVAIFNDIDDLKLTGEIFYDRRLGVFEYAGETTKKTEAEVMAEFGSNE